MRSNVTNTEVQADPGPEAWETIEITPAARVASVERAGATLLGGLLLIGAVVGAGLLPVGIDRPRTNPGADVCPPTAATVSSAPTAAPIALTREADPTLAPSVIEKRFPIVVLMPAPEEVVLGAQVVVAGRVNGTGPGPAEATASRLHVAILAGANLIGEADVDVIGAVFAGSIAVVEQARGQIVELRVSDGRRPSQILMTHQFVLGPGR